MKSKILHVFICILCVSAFSACGKPSNLSDTSYQLIKKVYDTMGNYLSGELVSAKECETTLDELQERIDNRSEGLKNSDETEKYVESQILVRVSLNISDFTLNLKYGTEEDLEEAYDSVGKEIGK